jgi:hypothetical protein
VEYVFVLDESESESDDEGDRYEEGSPSLARSVADAEDDDSNDAERRSDVSKNADMEGNPDPESEPTDELKFEGRKAELKFELKSRSLIGPGLPGSFTLRPKPTPPSLALRREPDP